MSRYLRLAWKQCALSTHPHHRLGAVIVKGGAVLSSACNLHRRGHCAERRALRPHADFEGATLYCVRANGGISKPCVNCMLAIDRAGIAEIVYVNHVGEITKEKRCG